MCLKMWSVDLLNSAMKLPLNWSEKKISHIYFAVTKLLGQYIQTSVPWFRAQFLPTQTPASLSTGLFSSILFSCVGITGITCPRWRTWHLFLLHFPWSLPSQLSSLFRSLCKAFLRTAPPSLVASASVLNARSIPAGWITDHLWKH